MICSFPLFVTALKKKWSASEKISTYPGTPKNGIDHLFCWYELTKMKEICEEKNIQCKVRVKRQMSAIFLFGNMY